MLERISEINALEDLTNYIKEDLCWYYQLHFLNPSCNYSENQIKKLAIIATICNAGKRLEMLLNKKKQSNPFSFYIKEDKLYFKMYKEDEKDPFLYITKQDESPGEVVKNTLDRYTDLEIAKICHKSQFNIFLELK